MERSCEVFVIACHVCPIFLSGTAVWSSLESLTRREPSPCCWLAVAEWYRSNQLMMHKTPSRSKQISWSPTVDHQPDPDPDPTSSSALSNSGDASRHLQVIYACGHALSLDHWGQHLRGVRQLRAPLKDSCNRWPTWMKRWRFKICVADWHCTMKQII